MPFCYRCGKPVEVADHFCHTCGADLRATQTAPVNPINPHPETIRILSQKEPRFRVKCEYCLCVFEYGRQNLGYRTWYPNGFVYCPRCEKPLRHHMSYEIKD